MQYNNGVDNNGIITQYQYNNRGLLASIQSPVLGLNYTYDNVGNITSINNETYSYDGLNRLLTASKPGHSYQVSYLYDAAGNRTQQLEDDVLAAYTYNAVNELTKAVLGRRLGDINGDGAIDDLDRVALNNHNLGIALITDPLALLAADCNQDGFVNSADSVPLNRHVWGIELLPDIILGQQAPAGAVSKTTYTWDARGNLIGKVEHIGEDTVTWAYTYNLANRLTQVANDTGVLGTYAYDASGMRAKKVEGGSTTHYLTLGHQVMYEKTGTGHTHHIFAGRLACCLTLVLHSAPQMKISKYGDELWRGGLKIYAC